MSKLIASLLLAAALSVVLASAALAQGSGGGKQKFSAELAPLNGSGANGTAKLTLEGRKLTSKIHSEGLAPNLPHAQHIHGMAQAISECPTLANDQNGDGLVNTVEGLLSYGPIRNSFTTRGDTSPESALAVNRFPVAGEDGSVNYSRTFPVAGVIVPVSG